MSHRQIEANLQQVLPRARLCPTPLPAAPEVRLFLFDPRVMEGPLSHDEAQAVVAEPAYWSFCWASGQAMAAFLAEQPEWVLGKRVLDFGAGSGVAGIAAARAGAREVIACDLDALALDACAANADLNGVTLTLTDNWLAHGDLDLILASDVLYDRDNLPLLNAFLQRAPQVLLADSRVRNLAEPGYRLLTQQEYRTLPDLNEFEEFNWVRIYAGTRQAREGETNK